MQGAGCGVQGAGCKVQGAGCRVYEKTSMSSGPMRGMCAPDTARRWCSGCWGGASKVENGWVAPPSGVLNAENGEFGTPGNGESM